MSRVAMGLPGVWSGAKAHGWFMRGHAAGSRGKAPSVPDGLSVACQAAYMRGHAAGAAERERARARPDVGAAFDAIARAISDAHDPRRQS
jgi:hypothetical protein